MCILNGFEYRNALHAIHAACQLIIIDCTKSAYFAIILRQLINCNVLLIPCIMRDSGLEYNK